jgi:thiamine biosynthesis lipoprotein
LHSDRFQCDATGFNAGLGCGFDADRAARWSTRIGALAWLRLAAFCALVLTAGCDREADRALLALSGSTMGTSYSVQVADPPSSIDLAALQRRIDALLAEVNGLMSTYQPDSELSRFNSSRATDWFPVSAELARVVDQAQAVSAASNGAFDVTVGPLVNLWGFGPERTADRLPTQPEIDAALANTGHAKLEVRLDPPALRKALPDLYVDLSAIAKGYGVDRVAALLAGEGIANALVEIGGELNGRGHNGRGEPWRIAVERPDPGARRLFRVVPLRDMGMATSGDYRNFFTLDGKRYSHSIDPSTGRPVTHSLASVTVLAESSMQADAWATALLVLGPQRGFDLAHRRGMAALLISHDGERLQARSTEAFDQVTRAGDR